MIRFMVSVRNFFIGCIAVLAATASVCAQGMRPELRAASDDQHLWIAADVDASRPGVRLYHHPPVLELPVFNSGPGLTELPAAMAAWGSRVWIVGQPRGVDEPRRDVFALRVERNPLSGMYYFDPPDRLSIVEELPGLGRLAGVVGTPDGAVALLLPEQFAESTVEAGPRSQAAAKKLNEPRLLLLQNNRWSQQPLPAEFWPALTARLAIAGEDGETLVILSTPLERPLVTRVYEKRLADADWTCREVSLDLRTVRRVTRAMGQVVVVRESDDQATLLLDFLRPSGLLSLGSFDRPQGAAAVVGFARELEIVHAVTGPKGPNLLIQRIDPVSGSPGSVQTLQPQSVTAPLLHMPLLLALAMGALLMAFLFRPPNVANSANLPASQRLAPLGTRSLALLIDLLPPVVLTLLVLGGSLEDLLQIPFLTTDGGRITASVTVILLTVLHETVAEVIWGRSLGKLLLGVRVSTMQGGRARAGAVLIRNAYKLIAMLVPPLAVFALMNPNLQGLGDSVARTLVVQENAPVGRSSDQSG